MSEEEIVITDGYQLKKAALDARTDSATRVRALNALDSLYDLGSRATSSLSSRDVLLEIYSRRVALGKKRGFTIDGAEILCRNLLRPDVPQEVVVFSNLQALKNIVVITDPGVLWIVGLLEPKDKVSTPDLAS